MLGLQVYGPVRSCNFLVVWWGMPSWPCQLVRKLVVGLVLIFLHTVSESAMLKQDDMWSSLLLCCSFEEYRANAVTTVIWGRLAWGKNAEEAPSSSPNWDWITRSSDAELSGIALETMRVMSIDNAGVRELILQPAWRWSHRMKLTSVSNAMSFTSEKEY